MKRKTIVTALLVCIALYAPLSVFSQDFQMSGTVLVKYSGSAANVTIPAGVTAIGDRAFGGCSSLTGITVDAQNQNYSSVEGVLFNKDRTVLVAYPASKQGRSYAIPAGVTSIGDRAYYQCASLTSVTIPAGVTSIGGGAFNQCSSLTNVTIPAGVTSIGDQTFYFCTSLASVTIPNSITSIGERAFAGTSLAGISIPAGVKTIGNYAFYGCPLAPAVRNDIIRRFGEDPFASEY